MINLTSAEVHFTLLAVRQATALIQTIQRKLVTPALTKDDRSPVTVADFAAQACVGKLLADHFPNDPLVGEEDSVSLRTPEEVQTLAQITTFLTEIFPKATPDRVCEWIDRGQASGGSRFWTVDPIDGTKGFLRGMQYAIALALIVDGDVQIGALGCPNLNFPFLIEEEPQALQSDTQGSLVLALRGGGAWATPLAADDFQRLRVSARHDPSQARLLRSYESAHTNTGKIGELTRALHVAAEPIGMDSQAKYAVLAAGRGDLLVRLLSPRAPDYREKIWDQAAGSLIVEEAGGQITDLSGKGLDFNQGRTLKKNRGVLASNDHLHARALEALREIHA